MLPDVDLSIGLLSLVRGQQRTSEPVGERPLSRDKRTKYSRPRRAQQRTSENRPEQIRLTPNSAVPPPLIPEAAIRS